MLELHTHTCECGTSWSHTDQYDNNPDAHRCNACGVFIWERTDGKEHNSPVDITPDNPLPAEVAVMLDLIAQEECINRRGVIAMLSRNEEKLEELSRESDRIEREKMDYAPLAIKALKNLKQNRRINKTTKAITSGDTHLDSLIGDITKDLRLDDAA